MGKTRNIIAIDQIFMTHRERFVRFADSYVHHIEAAEDIVSESFLHCWEQRNNLIEVNDIAMYMLVIVKTDVWTICGGSVYGVASQKTCRVTERGD